MVAPTSNARRCGEKYKTHKSKKDKKIDYYVKRERHKQDEKVDY